MRLRFILGLLALLGLISAGNAQAAITIGSTTFELGINAFPSSVVQLSGSTPTPFGGISATQGLTGADIDTGAFNLDSSQVFELTYPVPIVNQPGADVYFTDSRFSVDALDIRVAFGDGAFHTIGAGAFTDTGVDSVIRNTSHTFDLYAATIDLSDFGFAPNASISTLRIRGVDQSDPIVVGNLNKGAVPEPSTIVVWSVLGMLGITYGWRRRRRSA